MTPPYINKFKNFNKYKTVVRVYKSRVNIQPNFLVKSITGGLIMKKENLRYHERYGLAMKKDLEAMGLSNKEVKRILDNFYPKR